MKISPFQALTILAKKYRDALPSMPEAVKFSQIQNLFLMGVQSDQNREQLVELLKDEALESYEVALGNKEAINNDPVRRYYESTLAHETLKATIDSLDMDTLNSHFNTVYKEMPLSMRAIVPFAIYRGSMDGRAAKKSSTAPEYIAAIKKLQDPKNFLFFKPTSEEIDGASDEEREQRLQERIDKMMVLLKTVHAAMTAVSTGRNENFPLNLYGAKDSPYSPERRGRKDRKDESNLPQVVKSTNLGIMRSYQPLGREDPLYEDPIAPTSGLYRRAADAVTYVPGTQMPEKFFGTEVSPFVNSISGTMLCQLRVMAKLLKKGRFELDGNPEQLKVFFKSMVSYIAYSLGGHSLQEYMSVLDLPEVKDMFTEVPGFDQLNLRTLFQDENEGAFRSSMDSVINYNDRILARRELHEELLEPELERELEKSEDGLTVRARSRLKSLEDRFGELASLDRKNQAIDGAYQTYNKSRDEENETVEEYNQRVKDAESVLVGKLRIKVDDIPNDPKKARYIRQEILSKMTMRQEELRDHLFSSSKTLPQCLDYAYEIYKNQRKTEEDRLIAQNFILYALDIKNENIQGNLNDAIGKLMLERELVKQANPAYIPGKSPLDLDETTKAKLQRTNESGKSDNEEVNRFFASKDLLDVNPLSKRKDKGELTGKQTKFFNEQERDMLRVLIRKGKFVQNGIPIDTSDCISHDKKGFAAFTLNVNGELSMFQHIDHDKTGIAHSSISGGAPVVGAGEIRIEKGKLISITDHSGHYRPSLYNTYKVLEYFKKQGIDIEEAKVLTLAKLSNLGILHSKSTKFSRFNEIKAEDLCGGYKAHLRAALVTAIRDLEKYQSPGILKVLGYIKCFIADATSKKARIVFAKSMVTELTSLNTELNKLQTPEEIQQFSEKLKAHFLDNSSPKDGIAPQSRLGNKMQRFREQLKDIKETYSDEEYTSSLKGINRD